MLLAITTMRFLSYQINAEACTIHKSEGRCADYTFSLGIVCLHEGYQIENFYLDLMLANIPRFPLFCFVGRMKSLPLCSKFDWRSNYKISRVSKQIRGYRFKMTSTKSLPMLKSCHYHRNSYELLTLAVIRLSQEKVLA